MTPVQKAEFAWIRGDQPGVLDFRFEPSPSIARAIIKTLQPLLPGVRNSNSTLRSLSVSDSPAGRYRLSNGKDSWFVRISSRLGSPELEHFLMNYLTGRGVRVNPSVIAGAIFEWEERPLRVDVRPFIEGRHFDGSLTDLSSLASTLSTCHQALIDFPRAVEVYANAAARFQHTLETRNLIAEALHSDTYDLFAEHAAWARTHRKWLSEMVQYFEPRFQDAPGAQCLHGEVHPANVLFQEEDKTAVLIDFEESVHIFAPCEWDLAFFVQRFCLRDSPSAAIAQQRIRIIFDAYGRPASDLVFMMRQVAWFSIAIIVDLRVSQGILTPLAEYDKFIKLEQQACAFQGIM